MSFLDPISASVSAAFDSVINTKVFYRDNSVSVVQAGIILLLPQVTAFLLQYNAEFGIGFKVQLENYPLLLFVFLVGMIYVLVEPSITARTGEEISKIAFLSIHLFAFALSLNLIYAVVIPVLGFENDPLAAQIANLFARTAEELKEPVFAMFYGIPFLLVAIGLVVLNSVRQYAREQIVYLLKSGLFWRSFVLAVMLAFYQYASFILIGKSAANG